MTATGPDAAPRDLLAGGDVGLRVVRGGAQRAAGFVAVNLITALAAVLLLRYLGVSKFGRYGTVMALLAIVQGVSDAGLSLTGSRELSVRDDAGQRRELLAHLLGLRMLLTGAGVVFAVGFAAVSGYGSTLVLGTAIGGAGVFLLSLQTAMLLPLVVELRNGRLALNEVLRQFVLVLCYVGLVVANAKLIYFFVAQLLTAVLLLLATPLLLHRHHLVAPRWTRERLRALALTTLPLAVSSMLSVLYFRILVILMSLLENSPLQLGYYVTSARVIEIFLALPVMLVGVVLPVLSVAAREDDSRLQFVTLRMTQVMALLGILLALILGFGAKPIITVMGGAQYAGAAPVVQIQCIALISIFITGGWTTTLVSMERTRALAITTAIGVVAVAILGAALIPGLGAKGGAVAAVIGDLVFSASVFVALRRAGPGRHLALRPFLPVIAATAPAVAIGFLCPLPPFVDATLAAIAFVLGAWLFGAVPDEIRDRVRGVLA